MASVNKTVPDVYIINISQVKEYVPFYAISCKQANGPPDSKRPPSPICIYISIK